MNQKKFLIATNVFAVAFLGLLAFSNGRPGAFEVDPHPFRNYETADNDQSFENGERVLS